MKYPKLLIILTQIWAIITSSLATVAQPNNNKTSVEQGGFEDLSPWTIWPGEGPPPVWDGQENYSDWESKVDFIEISGLAHERTQQDVRDVCKSFDFTLTVENFYLSGAMDWLEKYTLTARDSKSYRERGIVGSIAYNYLGDTGFRCGLGSTSLCILSLHSIISFYIGLLLTELCSPGHVRCPDVVHAVNDLDEARAIFFVLKSAQHLNLVFNIVQVRTPRSMLFL